jgi:hypothetical protein
MTNYLNTRCVTEKFTFEEFNRIPTDENGEIIDLYDAYIFITDEQRNLLSPDDYSRMIDLDEEMNSMLGKYHWTTPDVTILFNKLAHRVSFIKNDGTPLTVHVFDQPDCDMACMNILNLYGEGCIIISVEAIDEDSLNDI